MWQVKKDTVITWRYYDGDEFDGREVDLNKWIPAYSWSQANYRFDYLMTPGRLVLKDGACKFVCDRDTGLYTVPSWQNDSAFRREYKASMVDGDKFRYLFTCGNVWSRQKYGKGYFEIRFKSTDSYGMWPAFWLYGSSENDEIDFFELKGERSNYLHADVHCPLGCDRGYRAGGLFSRSFGGWIKVSENLNEGYNVLAGEWQDGYVKWYLNGRGICYFKGDFVSNKMSLIIGTGPAKDGYGFAPGINASSCFPNSLDVDYVRVWYKETDSKSEVLGTRHKTFSFYKSAENKRAELKKKVRAMYRKKAFANQLQTISILPSSSKKVIVTCLGKQQNIKLSFYEAGGRQVYNRELTGDFHEIDLSELTRELTLKARVITGDKMMEETVKLNN
jgi:beta-glucanase (GH16 family)